MSKFLAFVFAELFVLLFGKTMDTVTAVSSGAIWFSASLLCLFISLGFYRQEIKERFKNPPSVTNAITTSIAQTPSPSVSPLLETKEVQTQSLEERVYTTWTSHQLFESLQRKEFTSLQIDSMVKPHIDKWIKIDEQISNVSEYADSISITILAEGMVRIIRLDFEKIRWKPRLETLQPGDRLLAEGRITNLDQYTMSIDDCEVIDIRPKGNSSSKKESKDT